MDPIQFIEWESTVPLPPAPVSSDRFKFYLQANKAVESSGLYNPYELGACTIEVLNSLSEDEIMAAISSTNVRTDLTSRFIEAGFTVLDPRLYLPSRFLNGFFEGISGGHLSDSDFLLVDPFYGIIFFLDGDRPKHLYLIHDNWTRIKRKQSGTVKSSTPPSDALWQGSHMGNILFAEHLEEEHRESYSHALIPEVIVHSDYEYRVLTDNLVKWARKVNNIELWFRGQNREYNLQNRDYLCSEGLSNNWSKSDPSMVPSLYRYLDDYTAEPKRYRQLILEFGNWLSQTSKVLPPNFTIRAPLDEAADPFPNVPVLGWSVHSVVGSGKDKFEFTKDYHLSGNQLQRSLILQHYGFPTGWLDITCDPEVALWFAINQCDSNDGLLTFSKHSWNGRDSANWPTVFVFTLIPEIHPFINSGSLLLGNPSLRPQRQRCGLLGAAGNLARNYPARYVAMRIRLHPSFNYNSILTQTGILPKT